MFVIKVHASGGAGTTGGSSLINGALRAGVNNTGRTLVATIGRSTYTWQPGDTIYNPSQLRGLLRVQEGGYATPTSRGYQPTSSTLGRGRSFTSRWKN